MDVPLEVSFANMDVSERVEAEVRRRVDRLQQFYGRINSCHVYVTAPHQSQRKGNAYEIHVEVRVPGRELAVTNSPGRMEAHQDVLLAVRDAFNAMERRLKRWKQRRTGEVKSHPGQLQGKIVEMHPERDFGHIAATDGRLVYFHRNSVVGFEFDDLTPGDTVELAIPAGEGDKGPQASTVRPINPMKFVDERK